MTQDDETHTTTPLINNDPQRIELRLKMAELREAIQRPPHERQYSLEKIGVMARLYDALEKQDQELTKRLESEQNG